MSILEQFIQEKVSQEFVVRNPNHIRLIPGLVLKYFVEECPRTPPRDGKESDIIFDALKVIRDKRVAHHEDADLSLLSKTDLDGAIQLLTFAQTYVNLVGYGFFGFSPKGIVSVESFAPAKSTLWPELSRMIGLLEQRH